MAEAAVILKKSPKPFDILGLKWLGETDTFGQNQSSEPGLHGFKDFRIVKARIRQSPNPTNPGSDKKP